MNARMLRSVLAHAAAAAGPTAADDRELLKRFHADRDEAAFAELVRRHGRLVWAVCRTLSPSEADADDAFQATFLALMQAADKVQARSTVAPWLHAVAHRVAARARRTAARRLTREKKAATGEADGRPPPSAWDTVMTAVHEEVARLPETQRVPFVLCVLDGVGVTEAADRLGWKLGTLSGRLTRAKQTLLDRLAKRGVPAAAVGAVLVGPVGVCPAGVLAKAMSLPGGAASAAVRSLAEGVSGMALSRIKLLAAGLLVCGGLAAGLGGRTVADPPAPAGGQPKNVLKAITDPNPGADQEALLLQLTLAAVKKAEPAGKWEYEFVTVDQPLGTDGYTKLFHRKEADGWEFAGTVPVWPFINPPPPVGAAANPLAISPPTQPTLVFKRPARKEAAKTEELRRRDFALELLRATEQEEAAREKADLNDAVAKAKPGLVDALRKNPNAKFKPTLEAFLNANPAYKPGIEAYGRTVLEADVMTALATAYRKEAEAAREKAEAVERYLKMKPKEYATVTVPVRWNPALDLDSFTKLLAGAVPKRFPDMPGGSLKVSTDGKGLVTISGPQEMVEWAVGLTKQFTGEK